MPEGFCSDEEGISFGNDSWRLDEFQAMLDNAVDALPKRAQDIRVKLWSREGYNGSEVEFSLLYQRPETEEDRERFRQIAEELEQNDRRTYERLRKRFEKTEPDENPPPTQPFSLRKN